MKIDELKRIAEENNYVLTRFFDNYKLERKVRGNCIHIGIVNANRIWISNISVCDDKDFNMIKAAVEFAETPIGDREEEKKYYLKHRWMAYENENNLTLCFPTGKYYLSHSTENNGYKTTFTLKEIEEIKVKFDTDLADFELVEVIDD